MKKLPFLFLFILLFCLYTTGRTIDANDQKSISGKVTDELNKAIPNAIVYNYNNILIGDYQECTCDKNGLFRIEHYPKNRLLIFAKAKGYAPATKKMDSSRDTVIQITMLEGHSVIGEVVNDDGAPLPLTNITVSPDRQVSMSSHTGEFITWDDYNWTRKFSADSEGKFQITDLPSSGIRFTFYKDGYSPQFAELELDKNDHLIRLHPTGHIIGSVVDDQTGKPISSFRVFVAIPDEYLQTY